MIWRKPRRGRPRRTRKVGQPLPTTGGRSGPGFEATDALIALHLDPHYPVWQRLARGGLKRLQTKHLGIQLMTKRLDRERTPVETQALEIHTFFDKWQRVLGAEMQQLTHV